VRNASQETREILASGDTTPMWFDYNSFVAQGEYQVELPAETNMQPVFDDLGCIVEHNDGKHTWDMLIVQVGSSLALPVVYTVTLVTHGAPRDTKETP
jgi:hypothetical protein